VATSSVAWSVELKFQNHRKWIEEVFGSNIITGDNPKIKKGKPAPDIFLAAADLLGVNSTSFWFLRILLVEFKLEKLLG